jgi:hypothetical protein
MSGFEARQTPCRQSSQIYKGADFTWSRSALFWDRRGPSADKIGKQPLELHRAGEQEMRLKPQLLGVRRFSGEQDEVSNCQGVESINVSVAVWCGHEDGAVAPKADKAAEFPKRRAR